MAPNLTSLLRGSGERHGPGSRYGKTNRFPVTKGFDHTSLLWYVRNTSGGGTAKITVNDGQIFTPNSVSINRLGHVTGIPARREIITGVEKTGIADGDSLWLKINWTEEAADPDELQGGQQFLRFMDIQGSDTYIQTLVTDTANGPDAHTHDIQLSGGTGLSDTAFVAAEMGEVQTVYGSASFEIYSVDKDSTREITYVELANFTVASNVVTGIEQYVIGVPLFVYPLLWNFGTAIGD